MTDMDVTRSVAAAIKKAEQLRRDLAETDSARSNVITLRVTAHERAVLDMVAARLKNPLSAFIRDSALGTAWGVIESMGGLEDFVRRYGEEEGERAVQAIQAVLGAGGPGPGGRT